MRARKSTHDDLETEIEKKLPRLNLPIPPELRDAIHIAARVRGVTMQRYVCDLLEEHVERYVLQNPTKKGKKKP